MTSPDPAWSVRRPNPNSPGGLGSGPSWRTQDVKRALERIEKAQASDAAATQALVEQVIVLHSIRKTLVWVLVLVPLILTALGVILLVSGQPADPY